MVATGNPSTQGVSREESKGDVERRQGGIRAVKSLAADAAIEDQTTKEWAAAEAARKAAAPVKKAAKKVVKKATAAAKST